MLTEAQKEAQRQKTRRYRERHRERLLAEMQTEQFRAKHRAINQAYYQRNREQLLPKKRMRAAAWHEENRERAREYARNRKREHPEKITQRYHSTEHRRKVSLLRSSLYQALKRPNVHWGPTSPIGALVGCTKPELRGHIEDQFMPGMTWENHKRGGFEIDHIRPCATFDLSDPAQQRACFHFTNLRPIWCADNQRGRRLDA